MPFRDIAQEAFDAVRKKYRESSLKSSNKTYTDEAMSALDDDPEVKRGRKDRFRDRDSIVEKRGPQGATLDQAFLEAPTGSDLNLVLGHALYEMEMPVLDCDELARMVCYRASIRTDQFAMVALRPAVHSFCVIGKTADWVDENASDYMLTELENRTWQDVFAVDVWLNVLCPLPQYGQRAAEKFESWTLKQKRISWVKPGDEAASWTVPKGDYSQRFLSSRISAC